MRIRGEEGMAGDAPRPGTGPNSIRSVSPLPSRSPACEGTERLVRTARPRHGRRQGQGGDSVRPCPPQPPAVASPGRPKRGGPEPTATAHGVRTDDRISHHRPVRFPDPPRHRSRVCVIHSRQGSEMFKISNSTGADTWFSGSGLVSHWLISVTYFGGLAIATPALAINLAINKCQRRQKQGFSGATLSPQRTQKLLENQGVSVTCCVLPIELGVQEAYFPLFSASNEVSRAA